MFEVDTSSPTLRPPRPLTCTSSIHPQELTQPHRHTGPPRFLPLPPPPPPCALRSPHFGRARRDPGRPTHLRGRLRAHGVRPVFLCVDCAEDLYGRVLQYWRAVCGVWSGSAGN
jgi:hypothetical protein